MTRTVESTTWDHAATARLEELPVALLAAGGLQRVDAGLQLVKVIELDADPSFGRDEGGALLVPRLDELADVGIALFRETQ